MNLQKRIALMSIYDDACVKYNVGKDKFNSIDIGREYSDQDREELAKFIVNCLLSPTSDAVDHKVMRELTREWSLEQHEARQFIKCVFDSYLSKILDSYLSKIGPLAKSTGTSKKTKSTKSK